LHVALRISLSQRRPIRGCRKASGGIFVGGGWLGAGAAVIGRSREMTDLMLDTGASYSATRLA